MAISGIFPAYFQPEKNFSKIGIGHILSIINTHFCAKNQKKLMMKSREKAQNPVFPAYFFFESRAPSHFGHSLFKSLCQKSEKNNEPSRSREKLVTNGRTDYLIFRWRIGGRPRCTSEWPIYHRRLLIVVH